TLASRRTANRCPAVAPSLAWTREILVRESVCGQFAHVTHRNESSAIALFRGRTVPSARRTETRRTAASDRDRLARSLAVDTRERRSTWLWENFSCEVSISGRAKRRFSGPRRYCLGRGAAQRLDC